MHQPKLALSFSLSLLAAAAAAQETQQVTITGRIIGVPLDVGGFGDEPLSRSPFAASRLTPGQLADAGVRTISDLTRLDAAVSDAYNAEGYWSFLSVRGFVLDNRYNYRRDGLPVNAETVLPLTNKSAVEILKGTSGIQAGTSAPGGLANLVVKRPTRDVREAVLEWREGGGVAASVDLSQRFGAEQAFGARLNAAAERLDPLVRHAQGERHLLAVAADWRPLDGTLIEAEIEDSRQSQPSVPGFSLLGATLPDARGIDPRLNLNNQSWSLPVVLNNTTGSLRWRQELGRDWQLSAHAMRQRLVNDDRIAFPFGCSADGAFDRYCSDGSFDFYDFRSDNERRTSDAFDLSLSGRVRTGGWTHAISAGVLRSRFEARFEPLAFNFVGTGRIDGSAVVPPDATTFDGNANRDERSTEWYLRDAVQFSPRWGLWAGVRHSRLDRESVVTDGSAATRLRQDVTTPWLALTHQVTPQTMAYASWGEGVETEVAPNLPVYANAGQVLPALKSRQIELGLKHDGERLDASVALFDIDRPQAGDACDATSGLCTRVIDGSARHRGIEGLVGWRSGPWQLHASAMWLDAARRGAADPALNGLRPTNVAARTLRLHAEHELAALPGLSLLATLVHEGDRIALPDNTARIPAWTRWDLAARYSHDAGGTRLTWRLGVDNVADRRAWKEAPFQFGHAYLFPLAPRTWRASLQAQF